MPSRFPCNLCIAELLPVTGTWEHSRAADGSRKMSWASKRETTKIGDIAYCLLGIFDINMPTLYKEGGKAFKSLQEEIIQRSVRYQVSGIQSNFPFTRVQV